MFTSLPPLIPLVFPVHEKGEAFNDEKEWERITKELDEAERQEPALPSPQKIIRVDYRPPDEPSHSPNRLPLFFPLPPEPGASHYVDKMRNELESLYCLYGTEGINTLAQAIFNSIGKNLEELELEDEQVRYIGNEMVPDCRLLTFSLKDRAFKLLPKIQERAAQIADEQLSEAGIQILGEATRYLAMNPRTHSEAQRILEQTEKATFVRVRGPDVASLIRDMRRIQEKQAELDREAVKYSQRAERNTESSSTLEDAAEALALTVMVKCREFPILHRIREAVHLTDDVIVTSFQQPGFFLFPSKPTGKDVIRELEKSIFATLQKCWLSNVALREEIKNDPEIVWRFPPLIHSTLEDLAAKDSIFGLGSVGARAAKERLEHDQENDPATSLVSTLSLLTGFLDILTLSLGAVPPIGLILGAIDLTLSAVGNALDFFRRRTEDRAFNAVLDPEKALSSEPGYMGFLIGVAFSLLAVKGFRNALRQTRFVSEAAALQKLAQASG